MRILVNGDLLAAIHTIGRNGPALREWWMQSIRMVPDAKRAPYRKAWLKRCEALQINPVRAAEGVIVHRGTCEGEVSAGHDSGGGVHPEPRTDPLAWTREVVDARIHGKTLEFASSHPEERGTAEDWFGWSAARFGSPGWCAEVIGCTGGDVVRLVRERAAEIRRAPKGRPSTTVVMGQTSGELPMGRT